MNLKKNWTWQFQNLSNRRFSVITTKYLINLDTRMFYTNIIDPFDSTLWTCYGVSVVVLTLFALLTVQGFQCFCPDQIKPGYDQNFLLIRMIFGITEPDKIKIRAKSKTSKLLRKHFKMRFRLNLSQTIKYLTLLK